MAGLASVNAVEPDAGEVVVVSGALGGVGLVAAQLARRRGATVIGLTRADYATWLQDHGILPVGYGKAMGTRQAGGTAPLRELAEWAATGALDIPIAAAFPLDRVQEAYRSVAERRARGKVVLHPQA